jgi:uncharacterized protein
LEAADPHLAMFGARPHWPDKEELANWRSVLAAGWRVVMDTEPSLARDVAADLQVIVPLAAVAGRVPLSATSGWAPGAVALSLPRDPVSCAETLIHEHRHCVLGLVEEMVPPLVDPESTRLCYAPWRDDPRPAAGLLHGCFAHVAITRFWWRRRQICAAEDIAYAELQFARWREATTEGIAELLSSGALTDTGECVAAALWQTMSSWQREQVSPGALESAAAINAERRTRWRRAHSRLRETD